MLSNSTNSTSVVDPIVGVLSITIPEARNLTPMDLNGFSDPYCKVYHCGNEVYKTNIIKKSLNPIWNESINILIHESQSQYSLQFKVYDWDKAKKDDFIGECEIEVNVHLNNNNQMVDNWYSLVKKDKKEKDRGDLHLVTRMVSYQEVLSAFWTSVCRHFSHTDEQSLNDTDFTALITAVNPDFPEPDIHLLFESTDINNDGNISVSELERFFTQTQEGLNLCTRLFAGNPNVLWEAYAISDSYSTIADNILNKGVTGTLKTQSGSDKLKTILVHNRGTGKLEEEKIPHYIEVSLRVMYSSTPGRNAVNNSQVKRLLKFLTNKTGRKYQSHDSVKEINPFIKFHNLNVDEILDPLDSFKNFNEFFYRKLKPESRPIADPGNSKIAVSPADCRLHVFPTIDIAKELWIKGQNFNLTTLIDDEHLAKEYDGGAIVIARLAPQDYHRFHVPVDGVIGRSKPFEGEYYTVNPIAIRQNLDVYCENKRVTTVIHSTSFGDIIFISVGATMVGSINITTSEGQKVKKGDEQGYFAFGGSTILLLFKPNTIEFDHDLVVNSMKPVETLVKIGTSLGKSLLQ